RINLLHYSINGNSGNNPAAFSYRQIEGAAARAASKLCRFHTTKLDAAGQAIASEDGQASCYEEDLGNGVKLELVKVPRGIFLMGTSNADAERFKKEYQRYGINAADAANVIQWEMPQHRVSVPSFYMGKFEITQAQWKAVLNINPSYFKGDDLPVEQIAWG